MLRLFTSLLVAFICLSPAFAESTSNIQSESELDTALKRAQPGDTLTLGSDIVITKGKTIPSDVTLDGGGHALKVKGQTDLFRQNGQSGAVVRNALLSSPYKGTWSGSVRNGDLRFENCRFDIRLIAWEHAQLDVVDSTCMMALPQGSDGVEPFGAYGDASSFSATNCLFVVRWKHNKLENGIFRNMGGNIASKLSLAHCTVIAGTDANPDQGGAPVKTGRLINRHLAFVKSDNTAGSDYVTRVTSSAFLGEASAVFFSRGSGTVFSDHNNNAGMLRNPLAYRWTGPYPPAFYHYYADDNIVKGREGDIEEYNPFVNAFSGDYRLMASSDSATGARDGRTIGARLETVLAPHNGFNLSFVWFDKVDNLLPPDRSEDLFYNWPIHREHSEQYFLSTADGYDQTGRALRFETRNTINETGGSRHNRYLTMSAYQRIIVNPGWVYTIRAAARRGTLEGRSWAQNGMYGNAILGVANGHVKNPNAVNESVVLRGPEGQWVQGEIRDFRADSNHMTLHLIHRTNGSYNFSEWDAVTIEGHPNPDLEKTEAE